MAEAKRKTHTSTQVKQKYNDKVYTLFSFRAPKDIAADFKKVCKDNNLSQAQLFKEAMLRTIAEYSDKTDN